MRRYTHMLVLFVIALSLLPTLSFDAECKKSIGAKTVVPPCPVWVIGSYDSTGTPNMMTASWVGICCSDPPSVTISLRRTRHSYGNIIASGAYTVNIPSEAYAKETAFFGSVSGRDVDKLLATGLTAVKSDLVNAPYLAEFPLVIECRLVETVDVGSHTMLIGEIVDVKADEDILEPGETPDPMKLKSFLFFPGNRNFFSTGGPIGSITDLQKKIPR